MADIKANICVVKSLWVVSKCCKNILKKCSENKMFLLIMNLQWCNYKKHVVVGHL